VIKQETDKTARRVAVTGLALALMLVLIAGWGALADASTVGTVSVVKTTDPEQLWPGHSRWVTYAVTFTNTAAEPVVLDRITDTLPAAFEFGVMVYGSQVGEPMDAVEPDIVWEAVPVPGNGTVTLRYSVRAVDSPGAYQNSVMAIADTEEIGPASALLRIQSGQTFLPIVARAHRPAGSAPLPFIEEFTQSTLEGWQAFTNWPGLSPDLWYWSGVDSVWGMVNYEYNRMVPEYTGYGLFLYDAPGAQEWTDYRIEARIKDIKEENQLKGLTGIWFRGTYQDSGAQDGRVVGGYYLYMKAADDKLYLMRTPPEDPAFGSQKAVASYYYAPLIGRFHWYDVIIEVRGSNIKVWFGDEVDGLVQAFDWTDPDGGWPSGTVGLAMYNSSARFDFIHVLP